MYKDELGRTAVHKAAYNGYAECLELLVNHGVDIDVTNNDGMVY